jgi:hypothetical protein
VLGRAKLDDLLVLPSHPGFVAPARRAIGKCRYVPQRKADSRFGFWFGS